MHAKLLELKRLFMEFFFRLDLFLELIRFFFLKKKQEITKMNLDASPNHNTTHYVYGINWRCF